MLVDAKIILYFDKLEEAMKCTHFGEGFNDAPEFLYKVLTFLWLE